MRFDYLVNGNGEVTLKTFKKVYIEITSVCNLACSFCPPTARAKGLIKVEQFNKILDEIRPHTKYIYLHVKGEPLLHPRIDQESQHYAKLISRCIALMGMKAPKIAKNI